MNKLTKAAIAGAAGIALLLGGAGSLALWNDTADLVGADIDSGTLTVNTSGSGAWAGDSVLWVPGDSFTYTDTLTISATGDNLEAVLSVNPASITGDQDLIDALEFTLSATGLLPSGITAGTVVGTFNVAPTAGTISLPVTVTVTFPSSVSDTDAQDMSVDLTGLNFLLQQQ